MGGRVRDVVDNMTHLHQHYTVLTFKVGVKKPLGMSLLMRTLYVMGATDTSLHTQVSTTSGR